LKASAKIVVMEHLRNFKKQGYSCLVLARALVFTAVFIGFFSFLRVSQADAGKVSVAILTQDGPKVLKEWSAPELRALSGRKGEISAQKLIIDESTKSLELTARADVDLVTFYAGKNEMVARVPRFLIWRGFLKLFWDKKTSSLRMAAIPNRLLVPLQALAFANITKIELAEHSGVYPGTALHLRTNPAASRGEKLFTQSCLACHSLPSHRPIALTVLSTNTLEKFTQLHHAYPGFQIDARDIRGLVAYREALDSEKNEVKPLNEQSSPTPH
jgi:mono/diheme cytochrome c family protein